MAIVRSVLRKKKVPDGLKINQLCCFVLDGHWKHSAAGSFFFFNLQAI
jgi:hypothetical protein